MIFVDAKQLLIFGFKSLFRWIFVKSVETQNQLNVLRFNQNFVNSADDKDDRFRTVCKTCKWFISTVADQSWISCICSAG